MGADAQKYEALEIIRALAALMVVVGHVFYYGLIPSSSVIQMLTAFGTEAVIIFFVLSGLVVTLADQKRPYMGALVFLFRRFVRIFPIFAVAIAISVLSDRVISGHWPLATSVIGNLLFLGSLGGLIVSVPDTNQALWSLAYEMTYYFLFSIVFVWPRFVYYWLFSAFVSSLVVSLLSVDGMVGHFIRVLSLSIPW